MNGKSELPPILTFLSDGQIDGSYRRRSRTPPNKSFSYVKDHHLERRNKSSFFENRGNNVMSKALNQISRSPFTCRIKEGVLPQQFT